MNKKKASAKSLNSINESLFWKKKEMISFFLSILVFLIHISTFYNYTSEGTVISKINEITSFFFKESITRFAVPMFFILSGIAFFKNYDNSQYIKKLKSRIYSLLIPYFLWNTLWLLFEIIASYSFISSFYIGREKFVFSLENILCGIFLHKYNIPFWFILYLFVMVVIAPIVDLLAKKKFIGFTALIVFALLTNNIYDIVKMPANTSLFADSIVYFLLGAIIGKHYYSFAIKKSSQKLQVVSVIYMVLYVVAKNVMHFFSLKVSNCTNVFLFILCAFSVWNIFDIFIDEAKHRPLYSRSFAIFALHSNVSAVITKLLYLILPKSEWFAIPNFIITIALTILLINVLCIVICRFLPCIYSVLTGTRRR